MAYSNEFSFAPGPWLPIRDQEALDLLPDLDMATKQGKNFENPDFEMKVVVDVNNYFATDMFYRLRSAAMKDEKFVMIVPSPENAVFMSVVENLNKFRVSCKKVHVFFTYEYANEKGEVAPWQSPYSRAGHFMRYFYNRLDADLRMPMENIHFWTKENADTYSDLIAAEGGADVCYTTMSWAGGLGAIDFESFPAETMEELMAMGSRIVTPAPEFITHESMRGMFGCSGDIGNVPPCAATIGPKDIAAAKDRVDVEYLVGCGNGQTFQKFPVKMAFCLPVSPKNTASLIRTLPGICYVAEAVAAPCMKKPDNAWLADTLNEIRAKEGN